MHQQIFVNLPIENMARSQTFFKALGYAFNPEFTNDEGACLVVGDNLFVMLLVKDFYATFTTKTIADARTTSEVLVCFSCDSREEVDTLVAKAVAAGGTTPRPVQDLGFMYSHGFDDLDGHTWEFVHMVDATKAVG